MNFFKRFSPKQLIIAGVIVLAIAGFAGRQVLQNSRPPSDETVMITPEEAKPITEDDIIKAAYSDSWDYVVRFLNNEAKETPDNYLTSLRTDFVLKQRADFNRLKVHLTGEFTSSVGPITIAGDTATFDDCAFDGTSQVKQDGTVVQDAAKLNQKVGVVMKRENGTWKQDSVKFNPEGSCTR